MRVLVILLPGPKARNKTLRGHLKHITENEIARFATQCILCQPDSKAGKSGLEVAQRKLNNLMLKVCSKLPRTVSTDGPHGAAHTVCLQSPHHLLGADTMVIGADVAHHVVGVSVAGVVASRDQSFVSHFSESRAQRPIDHEGSKTRRRKSEERIVELNIMVQKLLQHWKDANGRLPGRIFFYRDGVSDGQFQQVLTMELNLLADAFSKFPGGYNPPMAYIVGQKRHPTRFWQDLTPGDCDDKEGKSTKGGKGNEAFGQGGKGGKYAPNRGQTGKGGKDNAAYGKGIRAGKALKAGKDVDGYELQLEPGTVVSEGIARPGHLNFFLVAHDGIKGTSVPCHYHVLHLDPRLKAGIDDIERITFDLCHLYSRADKPVSYATPTYLADHLCERGKDYLEAKFGGAAEKTSAASSDPDEEEIGNRIAWFNMQRQKHHRDDQAGQLQGLNYFC